MEDGYHVFSLKKARIQGYYYPNRFPDYQGVNLKDLKVDDVITVRIFFKVEYWKNMRADGSYIDLEVEQIKHDKVIAVILTELPEQFPLEGGELLDIYEEEILYRASPTEH